MWQGYWPKPKFVKPRYPCTDLPLSDEGKQWYLTRKQEAESVEDGSRKRADRQLLRGYPHFTMLKVCYCENVINMT